MGYDVFDKLSKELCDRREVGSRFVSRAIGIEKGVRGSTVLEKVDSCRGSAQ
jgi:hypothetical protein